MRGEEPEAPWRRPTGSPEHRSTGRPRRMAAAVALSNGLASRHAAQPLKADCPLRKEECERADSSAGSSSWRLTSCGARSRSSRRSATSRKKPRPTSRWQPEALDRTGRDLQREPIRQRVDQRGDGELLLAEDRTHGPQDLPDPGSSPSRRVRLHRALLQPAATPLDHRLRQPLDFERDAASA